MTYIPIENKISLINKYIQINILRNKGKALHVDIPENDIFKAIIEDLKEHNNTQEVAEMSLQPVINDLKHYQEKQSDMRFQINTLMNALEAYRNEESGQPGLDEVINSLKELDKK